MPSLGIAPGPKGCDAHVPARRRAGAGIGRLSGGCEISSSGDWASSNQAFAVSRGSPQYAAPNAWARPLVSWHALVPFTFRLQVSHQTQEPPFEFLPAMPGMRQGASWRTTCSRSATGPATSTAALPRWRWCRWSTPAALRCVVLQQTQLAGGAVTLDLHPLVGEHPPLADVVIHLFFFGPCGGEVVRSMRLVVTRPGR